MKNVEDGPEVDVIATVRNADESHTPLPWRLELVEKWPFGIRVLAANVIIYEQPAVCHSSKQETRKDCEDGVGFEPWSKFTNREQAVKLIAEQDATAGFVVRAANSHYDLLKACKGALILLDMLIDSDGDKPGSIRDKLVTAIAKAQP